MYCFGWISIHCSLVFFPPSVVFHSFNSHFLCGANHLLGCEKEERGRKTDKEGELRGRGVKEQEKRKKKKVEKTGVACQLEISEGSLWYSYSILSCSNLKYFFVHFNQYHHDLQFIWSGLEGSWIIWYIIIKTLNKMNGSQFFQTVRLLIYILRTMWSPAAFRS